MSLFLVLLLVFVELPPQFDGRVRAGMEALGRSDLGAAQAAFEEATRLAPQQSGAWLLLAQTYFRQKKSDAALAAARKAEQTAGNDRAVLQGLANFYASDVRDFPKAAEFGQKYAELSSADSTAWRRLAEFCLKTGQWERAVAAGLRAAAADDSAGVHGMLGAAYSQLKQWDRAAGELARVVQLRPFDEQSHFALAQLYLQRQRFVEAAEVLEKARKTFDKSPQIELALGVAYYGQRKFPLAVDQFLKTIRLDPEVAQPYAFLGRMMDHLSDRMAEVAERFTQYQERHPESELGYRLRAQAMVAQLPATGFPAEAGTALELLRKAVQLKEDVAESHYYLGLLLERKQAYGEAAAELERSIAINPKDSAAHFRLARVYDRQGKRAEAAKERELHEKLSEEEKAPVRDK